MATVSYVIMAACSKQTQSSLCFLKETRNSPFGAISGPRNGKNGATNVVGPETDQMVQFLSPETDVMGDQNYILKYGSKKIVLIEI